MTQSSRSKSESASVNLVPQDLEKRWRSKLRRRKSRSATVGTVGVLLVFGSLFFLWPASENWSKSGDATTGAANQATVQDIPSNTSAKSIKHDFIVGASLAFYGVFLLVVGMRPR